MRKDSAIDWDKVEANELKMKGYTDQDIQVLQNMELLPKEMLELYLKNYIHQAVMYRKSYSNLLHGDKKLKEFEDSRGNTCCRICGDKIEGGYCSCYNKK